MNHNHTQHSAPDRFGAHDFKGTKMRRLESKIEELAREWEVKAESFKKYALMPKSAGINATQMLTTAAQYQISAEALRRALSECSES